MSSNPGGAADLGSTYATVGYRYDPDGMQGFLRGASDAQQAITRLQQTIAGQQPLSIPIAGLERAVAQQLTQIQQTVSRAKPFASLTREAAEVVAAVEDQFKRLASKRDQLQSTIDATGLSARDRRQFFDAQGRTRSNTADDQRYDTAFENAKRATSLARAEGDPNSVRAEIERAQAAAEKLRGVMAEIRSLQQTQGAGSKRNEIAVDYLEAAKAVEQYGAALQAATAQQAQAQARAVHLERRVENLGVVAADPNRSTEDRARADYLATAAAEQLREAYEREAAASAQAAAAERGHTHALTELTTAQERYQRSVRASQARQAPAAAVQPPSATPSGVSQPEEAARRVAAAYDVLDKAVAQYIVQAHEATSADQRQTASLNTLTEALQRVTAAEEQFVRAQGQRATVAPVAAPAVATAQAQQRAQVGTAQAAIIARAEIQANARVAAAKTTGDARIEQQRVAGVTRVEAAEKQATARTLTAQLAADSRVQTARIRAANQLDLQARRQAASGAALPRTFAGVTAAGATQGLGALGIATGGAEIIAQLKQLADAGQETQVALDSTRASLGALLGSQDRANNVFDRAIVVGERLGFTHRDTAEALRTSALLIRESAAPIEDVIKVLARLQILSPEQGLAGASLAIKELAAGDIVSLRERFEVSASAANKLKAEIKGGADAVQVLGRYLDEIGIGDGALEAQLAGAAGEQRAYNLAIEGLGTTINDVVTSSGWREFKTGIIGDTTQEIKNIQAIGRALQEAFHPGAATPAAGAGKVGGSAAVDTTDPAVRQINAVEEAISKLLKTGAHFYWEKLVGETEDLGTTADYAGREAEDLSRAIARADAAARETSGMARQISAYRQFELQAQRTAEALEKTQNVTSARALINRTQGQGEALADATRAQTARIEQFRDGVIAVGDQIEQATTARNERLDVLDSEHTDTVIDLTKQVGEATKRGEEARTAAIEKGAADRLEIEQENAERIVDFIADAALQQSRAAEDRARSDAREIEDLQQEQQRAQDDFNRSRAEDNEDFAATESQTLADFRRQRAEDNADFAEAQTEAEATYRERRQEIIDDYHENEVRIEQEHQRELVTTTREGQISQYRSTADFLERLYGLTRGRRNKGQLEQGRAALNAAIEEARELAKTDPQAAAALLAERQRQITEGIERERSNAQRRRDARRGGGLAAGDVEAEIAEVGRVTDEANRLTIEGIQAGARERAEERTRETAERRAGFDEQLGDLDQNYAEQKQKALDAHAARQADEDAAFALRKERALAAHRERQADEDEARRIAAERAAEDRAEQLRERDADRATEKLRRDADYASQLQELQESNRARLAEFDAAQRERIAQIEGQTADQVAAIKAQLADVDEEYKKARRKVIDDYTTMMDTLKTNLQEQANQLNLTPDQVRQAELAAAYKVLGEIMGAAFVAGLGGATANLSPGVPGAGPIRNGTTADDPRPSAQALRSLFGPSAVITSTYDSNRPQGQGVSRGPGQMDAHGGLDITMDRGSRVPAPFPLTVLKVSADQFAGGATLLALDDAGHQWLFAHMHGVPPFRAGQRIAKGATIGYIGAEGHVHVQERARNDASVPIDPTADLMAAAATAGTQTTTPAQRSGGGGGRVQAQSVGSAALFGPPAPLLPPVAAGSVALSAPVTVDLRGSVFGPGITEAQVRGWVRPVVDQALAARDQTWDREITDLGTRGALFK